MRSLHHLDCHAPDCAGKKPGPAAFQFALDRVANDPFIVTGNDRFDRQAGLAAAFELCTCLSHRQREIERARNRRGAKGQNVDQFEQFLELLLVHHPKPLFLVDDHQAKIFESDVVLNQPVRADDNVDAALAQ